MLNQHKLYNLTEVTPQLLQQQQASAAVFDLDDTLVRENTGLVTDVVIACMRQLHQHGIKVAILTNNFYKSYCQRIITQLHQQNINVLVVQNAFKPVPFGLQQIQQAFGVPMHQVVLIGDGYLTDWLAARVAGCQFIHAAWFKRPFYKHPALFIAREVAVLLFDAIRFAFLGHRPEVTWLMAGELPTQRRYLFLVNPKSGRTQADTLIADIRQLMQSHADCSFYIHQITRVEKLAAQFGEAIRQGAFTHLVVAGGDGSVREALYLIANYNANVTLGILPTGTGNLFAKAIGLPNDINAALRLTVEGSSQPVSVMRVNNTYGTLVAGMGLDATIMTLTDSPMKKRWGPLAYAISAVQAVNQKRKALYWIRIDDQKAIRRYAQSVMVVQRNQFAKAFLPLDLGADDADNFDVCILKASRWPEYIEAGIRLFFKQYKGADHRMEHLPAHKVLIRSWPSLPVHVDGDPIPQRHILAEVAKNAVQVITP